MKKHTFFDILSLILIFGGAFGCAAIAFIYTDLATKYEAVYSEEIKEFSNYYEKNGYHVCTEIGGREYIVDKYWKKNENTDSKISATTSKSSKTSKLKFKGVKNNKVKRYVSCNDTKNTPICTAEDGSNHEVDVYWKIKTKKQKEDEREDSHRCFIFSFS